MEHGRDFGDRYRPVGNVTTKDDVAIPSEDLCKDYFLEFLRLIKASRYKGYGLWCWDDAPDSIFDTFRTTPEFGA